MFQSFRQRVKFRGLDDIRVRALGGERLQAGVVTGYITERDESDGRLLRGLGDISNSMPRSSRRSPATIRGMSSASARRPSGK
jgi:hypothetical protein